MLEVATAQLSVGSAPEAIQLFVRSQRVYVDMQVQTTRTHDSPCSKHGLSSNKIALITSGCVFTKVLKSSIILHRRIHAG